SPGRASRCLCTWWMLQALHPPTGMSALHLSAYEGDANLVRGRIELGEDPNARDEVG
ncbi:unnamed protein product, partial [Ectocarpus sp. 8 AP-2014]